MEMRNGYKQTEAGVIPEDWGVARLDDLFEITSSKRVFQSEWKTDGIPFYRAREIAVLSEIGSVDNDLFISKQMYDAFRRAYGVPKVGDLLVTGVGTLGKVYVVPDNSEFYFKDGNIIWFKIGGAVHPAYLRQLYLTPLLVNQIADSSAGTTVGTYTISGAKKTVIPLPARAEQDAIAEALSAADALIESLKQLFAKKRHLKQGAMQELLTGKRRLPGFSGKWELKLFGEIAQPRKERIDPRRTVPQEFCIELEHIEQGTGCLAGYTSTSEGSSLKSVFKEGDVLFGKLRAYLRKYWLASREGVCSTEIWVLVAKCSLLIPKYLFQLVKTDRFIEAASSTYGTHMPRSDWNVVKNYEVRLPQISEQTAIVAILSDMDAEISALETKLAKARQLKQGMMQELLTGRIRLV